MLYSNDGYPIHVSIRAVCVFISYILHDIFTKLLARSDSYNGGWQRDLWVSYWRMADINEKIGDESSATWWRKAIDQLNMMKMSGMFISKEDVQYLDILKDKIQD
jgi:hypothetical protein